MPQILFRILKPLNLLLVILTYTFGGGLANYLTGGVDPTVFLVGLLWSLLLLGGTDILAAYFRSTAQPYVEGETAHQRRRTKAALIQISAAMLILAAGLSVFLLHTDSVALITGSLMLIIFFSFVFYAVPPFQFAHKGYGELILAIFMGSFSPGFGFLLQTDTFHRLLPVLTFPLTLLVIAYFLTIGFSTFARDLTYARHTLLSRLTWQRAIPIHHLLILIAYLCFAAAPLLGIPWAVIWPAFLTLPLGIIQIYWLQRIALGNRPVWNFLIANSTAVIGLTAYVLALTLWLR